MRAAATEAQASYRGAGALCARRRVWRRELTTKAEDLLVARRVVGRECLRRCQARHGIHSQRWPLLHERGRAVVEARGLRPIRLDGTRMKRRCSEHLRLQRFGCPTRGDVPNYIQSSIALSRRQSLISSSKFRQTKNNQRSRAGSSILVVLCTAGRPRVPCTAAAPHRAARGSPAPAATRAATGAATAPALQHRPARSLWRVHARHGRERR